jgi:hypothetical protein
LTPPMFLSAGACLTACPFGSYGDATDRMCKPCASTCGSCAGPSDSQCTSCLASTIRQLAGSAPAACDCMLG